MSAAKGGDLRAPSDARLYRFRTLESVFPLPDWGRTIEEWKQRRAETRSYLEACSGVTDAMRAFRPTAHAVRTFTCGDLSIENLSIETLPGFFVQANLAKRADATGRLPLMLNPHGHMMSARTTAKDDGGSSVPHRLVNFALQGFVSFAWSMVGFEKDSMQLDHRILLEGPNKARANLWGFGPFALQTHNSMKLLDYLVSRDDVDASRVGCNGASGGGTQTYFLAAIDDRVGAAAPVVMLSGHFQGGCVCENHPLLRLDYSNIHYAGLIAPRPLLLCGCTGDWSHHLVEREYASLRQLYALHGAEDRLAYHMVDESHNYNRPTREAVYAWMRRWLVDSSFTESAVAESDHPVPSTQDLLVYDCPVPPHENALRGEEAAFSVWEGMADAEPSAERLMRVLDIRLPRDGDLLVRGMTPRYRLKETRDLASHQVTCGRFSEGSSVQCNLVLPRDAMPMAIYLDEWGEEKARGRFVKEPPEGVRDLVERGLGLAVPALFLQEGADQFREAWRARSGTYLFTTYNKTKHAQQAMDLLTVIATLTGELSIPPDRVAVAASQPMSLAAFVAWAAAGAEGPLGPFVGDFGGMDLESTETWAAHAYFPFVLLRGGLGAISGLLCSGRRGVVCGVRAAQHRLFPDSFEVIEESRPIEELLARCVT